MSLSTPAPRLALALGVCFPIWLSPSLGSRSLGWAGCGELCGGLGWPALPQVGGVAPIPPPAPGGSRGLSGHYLGLEYEVDLEIGGFDARSCCSPVIQQRDEAGSLRERALISPLDPSTHGGLPHGHCPTRSYQLCRGLVLDSQQLPGQLSAKGFPCGLLLVGCFGTFKSQ